MQDTLDVARTFAAGAVPTLRTYARAVRLIELGARASLVCQLTSLPRATVKTWYQRIHRRPSPPGLAPFADTWYLQTIQRMLHTTIVWKLGVQAARLVEDPAQRLIAVYESYSCAVPTPLLSITRAYFVPRLLSIEAWRTALCRECGMTHIAPVTEVERLCPACTLQRIHRCPRCKSALGQKGIGRRITRCARCRGSLPH
jgi:hypothetical protein